MYYPIEVEKQLNHVIVYDLETFDRERGKPNAIFFMLSRKEWEITIRLDI